MQNVVVVDNFCVYEIPLFQIFFSINSHSTHSSSSIQIISAFKIVIGNDNKICKPKNPFSVTNDSSEIVWNRATQFLEKRKLIIVGGTLQINDSLICMPYYNDYHKGTSLKIQRRTIADSVWFTVKFWNSGKPNEIGAKEIALFMNSGIDRYDKDH